jgi:hypothetical protein
MSAAFPMFQEEVTDLKSHEMIGDRTIWSAFSVQLKAIRQFGLMKSLPELSVRLQVVLGQKWSSPHSRRPFEPHPELRGFEMGAFWRAD